MLLFTRFRFGSQVASVRDNIEAAREMGINVKLFKLQAFAFVGLPAGLASVLAILINNNFYPTVGDGYLLVVLAAVFVGARRRGAASERLCSVSSERFRWVHRDLYRGRWNDWLLYSVLYGLVIVLSLVPHRLTRPARRSAGAGKRGCMAPLRNPLVEEMRFPSVVPPLPHAAGGPDPVVRASVVSHAEASALSLNGVTSRGVEVRIIVSAVAPSVVRVQLMSAGAPNRSRSTGAPGDESVPRER